MAKKVGAPVKNKNASKLTGKKTARIVVQATPENKAKWQNQADGNLSKWITDKLNS